MKLVVIPVGADSPDPALLTALFISPQTLDQAPTGPLSKDARHLVDAIDPFRRYREVCDEMGARTPVQRMLFADTTILLPDTYLEKVDKPTMAHGVEVRVPFLDSDLTDFALSLPPSLKVHRAQKKYLLRAALRGVLPDDILDRPKTGFGVPVAHWVRGPLAGYIRAVLLDPSAPVSDWLDRARVESLLRAHAEGRRNNGPLLYKLMCFALWLRGYFEHSAPPQG